MVSLSLHIFNRNSNRFNAIDIPYPSPADRKDLESLVKSNWETKVQKPIGHVVDQTSDQWHNTREWIFDTSVYSFPYMCLR